MKKPKILIEVEGGLIQCIRTNTKDIDICVVDYDSLDWADGDDNLETIEDSASMQMHYKPDIVCEPVWKKMPDETKQEKYVKQQLIKEDF